MEQNNLIDGISEMVNTAIFLNNDILNIVNGCIVQKIQFCSGKKNILLQTGAGGILICNTFLLAPSIKMKNIKKGLRCITLKKR